MARRVAARLVFDTSVAAQPAPAVLMWSAAQALPKISECVLHRSHRTPAKAAGTFAMELSIFVWSRQHAARLLSRPWSGFEKKSPARRIRGKANCRDAASPFFLLSNSYFHQLASVRGLSVPAIDSRMDVSACTFFIR